MMLRRLVAAMGIATALLCLAVPNASAECFPFPTSATTHLDVGYAFVATVTESSRDVDPPDGDYSTFNWHVELAVDRTHLGKVPTTIIYNGWDAGCHELRADHFKIGDKVFILAEEFHSELRPRDPFDGDVVVWKAAANGWRFDPEVLMYAVDTKVYTKAVREASTTAAILHIVAAASLPQTDTVATPVDRNPGLGWPLILVLVGAFLLGLAYLARRDIRASNSRDIQRR